MKLSQVKPVIIDLETIGFQLPNAVLAPSHFHFTGVGKISKHFIDYAGTVSKEDIVNFHLWNENDYDHRQLSVKLLNITELSKKVRRIRDLEIEIDYQVDTIVKFRLNFDGQHFLLPTIKPTAWPRINAVLR